MRICVERYKAVSREEEKGGERSRTEKRGDERRTEEH